MALAISGEPVTRPPISSVSRRRFSSIGEGPITCGRILAAACAQLEASVAEQAAAEDWLDCMGIRESFAGGSCAEVESAAMKQRSNEVTSVVSRRIRVVSAERWRWVGVDENYWRRHAVHPGAE